MNPNLKRLRRSMMFLNCQKPSLIKDPYVYKPDSILLDLEDAVAEREKDAARYSLFHALKEIDYRGVERRRMSAAPWPADVTRSGFRKPRRRRMSGGLKLPW